MAHELALAKLDTIQAELTLGARETQFANDQELSKSSKLLLETLRKDKELLKKAGHIAFLNTHDYGDLLMATAFRAERSVEIYTFQNQSAHVSYDTGHVGPDVEHDFGDDEIGVAELIARYNASLGNSLDPISLQDTFEKYFTGNAQFDLAPGVVFRSFTEEPNLSAFKSSRTLRFTVDLPLPPTEEFEARLEDIHVALIGATAPRDSVTCRVRHGSLYSVVLRTGEVFLDTLQPHVTQREARFTPLQVIGTLPTSGSATLDAPRNLSFWGRGVAGDWELTLPASEIVDLAGLTEIQVWLTTQVFIPITPQEPEPIQTLLLTFNTDSVRSGGRVTGTLTINPAPIVATEVALNHKLKVVRFTPDEFPPSSVTIGEDGNSATFTFGVELTTGSAGLVSFEAVLAGLISRATVRVVQS